MFELGIFGVVVLAVAYWSVLWLMGRREDVLHGEFVEGDEQANAPVRSALAERPIHAVFPEKPIFPEKPVFSKKPVRAVFPAQPAFQPERLQSLLNAIKRDLDPLVPK